MKELIIDYWKEMFVDYRVHKAEGIVSFAIPGFPDPLLSANFGNVFPKNQELPYLNTFSESGRVERSFKLCFFDSNLESSYLCIQEDLKEAVKSAKFWEYQKQHNPESYPFMEKLLPFLAQKAHYHFYIEDKGQIVSSLVLGETSEVCLLLNASTAETHRGQGLIFSLKAFASQKPHFYWTRHPWLTLKANYICDYYILRS